MKILLVNLNTSSLKLENKLSNWVNIWQNYYPYYDFSITSLSERSGNIKPSPEEILSIRNRLKNYDCVIALGDVVYKALQDCSRTLIKMPYSNTKRECPDEEVCSILRVLGYIDFLTLGTSNEIEPFSYADLSTVFGAVSSRKN